jgi:hypothetical protein
LNNNVKITLMKRKNPIHASEIDTNPTPRRSKVSLQTSPAGIRRHGDKSGVADLHAAGYFVCGGWVEDEEGLFGLFGGVGGPV